MRQEAELVPYVTTRLAGSPLLVLAPHPDDEVFGCGAVLLEAARSGCDIHTVIVTDGDAQGDPEARRRESREAARRMATPEPIFWAFGDRRLTASDPDLLERIRQAIVDIRPELLLVTSPAEMHPDHRALALATYRVLRSLEPREIHPDFHLAAYEVSAFLRPNVLVDVTAAWETLVHAAEAFGSQNTILPYIEVFSAVTSVRRLTLGPGVTRAAAYHRCDHPFIRENNARRWASHMGPSAGLDADDSQCDSGGPSNHLFARLRRSLGRLIP